MNNLTKDYDLLDIDLLDSKIKLSIDYDQDGDGKYNLNIRQDSRDDFDLFVEILIAYDYMPKIFYVVKRELDGTRFRKLLSTEGKKQLLDYIFSNDYKIELLNKAKLKYYFGDDNGIN